MTLNQAILQNIKERNRIATLQAALKLARDEIHNPGANRYAGKDILEIIEHALQA